MIRVGRQFSNSSRALRTASIASASPEPSARDARAAPRRSVWPTWRRWRTAPRIMPAPAVKFVDGSIRMKLPVLRLSAYRSKTIGRAVETVDRPDLIEQQRVIHLGGHRPRGVFQQVHARRVERPLVHPHDIGPEPLPDVGLADCRSCRRG